MSDTLEIARFRLQPGATEEAFLAAANALGPWLRSQPGFRHRVVSKGAEGQWSDFLFWASPEAAAAAGQAFMGASETQPMLRLIDPDSVSMVHEPIAISLEG